MNKTPNSIPCRLCGEQADFAFSKPLMWGCEANYFCCQKCQSLESEPPTWLHKAYSEETLVSDISTLQRVASMQKLVFWLRKILKIKSDDRVLDWGGGNGMLVRHLRDLGIDAYVFDKFVKNAYAVGFDHVEGWHYRMITSFQVWEHFAEPGKDLDELFALEPDYVIMTTGLYVGQNKDWDYVNPCGRHVFCYSEEGRHFIARKYGYQAIVKGGATLFSKHSLSAPKRMLIRLLFSSRIERLRDVLYVLSPKRRSLVENDRQEARRIIYTQGKVGGANWP